MSHEIDTDATAPNRGRRRFLKTVPVAMAAGLATPAFARQQPAGPPPASGPITTSVLKDAEAIDGMHYTDAEAQMALRNVNDNLESYDTLRKVDVPLGTEPAFTFRPYMAGKKPTGASTRNATLKVSRPAVHPGSSLDSIAFAPVIALAPLLESKQVSSTELTKMYLARLKKYGPPMNCVITLTENLALEQAAQADREIRAGQYRGPLHGIPWGGKDLLSTRGIRTTWGAKPYENQVPDVDATVVERLRDAGAVLVAKLSMGALAQGDVWYGGKTRNPWDIEKGSSGSSAGPGAATGGGLVGFAIGTETLGSIMSPSSTCGVTGLRPTYGRVSRYGAMALSWTMDKLGPMARGVEDCALVFNAIYGSDGRDTSVMDAPFHWNPDVPLSSLRIGYVQSEFERAPANLPEARRAAFEQQMLLEKAALDVFRKAGAKLEPITLPDFPARALTYCLDAEAGAAFDDLTRSHGVDQMVQQGPNAWPNTFRSSRFIPAVEYIRGQRARRLLMQQMDQLMSTYDVFISPMRSASLTITNFTGHPALALKCGFDAGMPQAIMLTGRLYDEATLLRAGLAYEQATKWHTMNPDLEKTLKLTD
ncbi:MAG TPA: amidase [Vicinamibacterales bacterium]|jgi:Asp-tRNA(Asn)/Glu-tRNA(Gln) amidotransferase A subunit family amidase